MAEHDTVPVGRLPTYQRWDEGDRAGLGDAWVHLSEVFVGECVFVVLLPEDAVRRVRTFVVREGDTVPVPGVFGWSLELLGCRPRAMRSRPWAAVRLARSAGVPGAELPHPKAA